MDKQEITKYVEMARSRIGGFKQTAKIAEAEGDQVAEDMANTVGRWWFDNYIHKIAWEVNHDGELVTHHPLEAEAFAVVFELGFTHLPLPGDAYLQMTECGSGTCGGGDGKEIYRSSTWKRGGRIYVRDPKGMEGLNPDLEMWSILHSRSQRANTREYAKRNGIVLRD